MFPELHIFMWWWWKEGWTNAMLKTSVYSVVTNFIPVNIVVVLNGSFQHSQWADPFPIQLVCFVWVFLFTILNRFEYKLREKEIKNKRKKIHRRRGRRKKNSKTRTEKSKMQFANRMVFGMGLTVLSVSQSNTERN